MAAALRHLTPAVLFQRLDHLPDLHQGQEGSGGMCQPRVIPSADRIVLNRGPDRLA